MKIPTHQLTKLAQNPGRLDVADVFDLAQGCREVLSELSQAKIELTNARIELVTARAEVLAMRSGLPEGKPHRRRAFR